MDFDALIVQRVEPILRSYGFKLLLHHSCFFQFQSNLVELVISFDTRENSHFVQIGSRGVFMYPLDDRAIKELFDPDIQLESASHEQFVSNLNLFMQNNGAALFKGNPGDLDKLRLWVKKDSKEYTERLMKGQLKEAADKAWKGGDYDRYIKLVNQIGLKLLPGSYSKKYEMAVRRLSQ
ncbi:MAG: hypothetical protein Q8927_08610 [Bacteroidota bacterium]|nr:hypothetical protein [Bacteroidota bacterium]MDP4245495.1 hypothetical protein [Bacteroidota bacterium]MDP4259982.1 hypothetical protein [Bacteroidota bacterium]